ncbi:MAG: aldo/keto reductase [Thermoplasmatota archaeon]
MSLPTMRMGATGVKVTRICLGTMGFGAKSWRPWVIEEAEALPVIRRALDLGVNFFDTADVYSLGVSERIVGKALSGRRDEVVLATKVCNAMGPGPNDHGLSRKHIHAAIHGSLERLGTDSIDLYQIHRWDAETPIAESLSTLSSLVDAGQVRYLGASTMWAWQFARAVEMQRQKGWHPFVMMQNHWNLVYREEEREMVPLCRELGIGIIPWSPLARGFLAGAARGATRPGSDAGLAFYADPTSQEIRARVEELARQKGAKPAQISLAWVLAQPEVVAPIVGVTKVSHVEEAVAALEMRLSEKDREWLEEPYRPRGVAGWVRGGGVPRQHLDPNEP